MRRITGALVAMAFSIGCSNGETGSPKFVDASDLRGTITVSAAASLTESFTELADQFRRANPKVKVQFNFGSSSSLVTQIQSGAPADVIATADLISIEKLVTSGHVNGRNYPQVFARNSLTIAVKPGNPLDINTISDLANARFVALCGTTIPCGIYAESVIARAGLTIAESKITRGVDARATLSAVATGDADAAVVYYTDVLAAGKTVTGKSIPLSQNVDVAYGIAPIRDSQHREIADAFIAFTLSEAGRQILESYGFKNP